MQAPVRADRDDDFSVLDSLVAELLQTNPIFASQSEASKLRDTAALLKQGLSGVKDRPPRRRSPATRPFLAPRNESTVASTNTTLAAAREVVRKAQAEANARNVERLQNPRLNHYFTSDAAPSAAKRRALAANLLTINSTVADAAALVAEADADATGELPSAARDHARNQRRAPRPTFWMEEVDHNGHWPFGGDDNAGYQVFRNVKDYGAVGDGKTDDTKAINRAMAEQNRCGPKCGSSSVKGAIIYFPAGLIACRCAGKYDHRLTYFTRDLPYQLDLESLLQHSGRWKCSYSLPLLTHVDSDSGPAK